MKIQNLIFITLIIIFKISFSSKTSLSITRSKSYNSLTPLTVHISTPDTRIRLNPIDLILLVDDSGSMRGQKISLIKETLPEMINLMSEEDRLSIIKFTSSFSTLLGLTNMDNEGKQKALKTVSQFKASGGTNIFNAINAGFNVIKNIDYTKISFRIPTIILLSDGEDNNPVVDKFRQLMNNNKKDLYKIPFTLHTFGYGSSHDANLMYELSKVRDGGYFSIFQLANVKNAWIEIFGFSVTMLSCYSQLKVESNFTIVNLYGKNEMNIISSSSDLYQIEIIQLRAGKSYDFVFEINIPENTQMGTEILKATFMDDVVIYQYYNEYDENAYEQYIRGIIYNNLTQSYNQAKNKNINNAKNILSKTINWLQKNYEGLNDWEIEMNDCILMYDSFNGEGKGDILSRIREGTSQKPGVHYDEQNSYQNFLIENAFSINVTGKIKINVSPNNDYTINCSNFSNDNYFYLYSESGKGLIHVNDNFEGNINNEHNSFIYSTDKNDCILTFKTANNFPFSFYFWYEKKNDIFINIHEYGTRNLLLVERDFPLEFYSLIDGTKDLNFNIEILELEKNETEYGKNISDHFTIEAYIVDQNQIENIKKNLNPDTSPFIGFYDPGFRLGKIVISRYDVKKKINSLYKNYMYVRISKGNDNPNNYTKIKGLYSFTNLNNIYKAVPSDTYIISNLLPGQKTPNLYLLQTKFDNEKFRLEFSSSSNEINFALLNYTLFQIGDKKFYENDTNLELKYSKGMGKNYIDIKQKDDSITSILLSIFSTNGDHIAGSEPSKISYTFNYYITTDNEFNVINTIDLSFGEKINFESKTEGDKKNLTFSIPKTIYNETSKKVISNAKYFFKFYPIIKRSQKLYNTISLFETNPYEIIEFKNIETQDNYLKCEISDFPNDQNYFVTISSLSEKLNTYKPFAIYRTFNVNEPFNVSDDNPFGYELSFEKENETLSFYVNGTKNYLVIQTTDFENNKFVTFSVTLQGKTLKAIQPSNNYLIIPKQLYEKEEKITLNLKNYKMEKFYLYIELTDSFNLNVNENLIFEYIEEYGDSISINLINKEGNTKPINVFVRPSNIISNDFSISSYNVIFEKSVLLNGYSANIEAEDSINLEIKSKKGEIISLYSRIINFSEKKKIEYYNINAYGYLQQKNCFFFDNIDLNMRYQVRIIGDKKISLKYFYQNSKLLDNETIDILNENEYYYKELNEQLTKVCLKQIDDLDSIFFNLQIVRVDNQDKSTLINEPLVFNILYKDSIKKNEIRYYRQGFYENNLLYEELKYVFSLKRLKGEILVYYDQCLDYPNCIYSKEVIEQKEKESNTLKKLYYIDEVFILPQKSKEILSKLDYQKPFIYLIQCLSDICSYEFSLHKNDDVKNLNQLKKYSNSIKETDIDKYSVQINNDKDISKIIITLFTHSGEVMLSTNKNCNLIKHTIIGSIEKFEIPKECDLTILREIYVQANIDSTYTIEYIEENKNDFILNSNIIHLEFLNKKKNIIYEKKYDKSLIVKFIPVNCEIEVNYNQNSNLINKEGNLFYHYIENSPIGSYHKYEITTNSENECLFYTYSEEFSDYSYNILSEQVPYYLTLSKNTNKYKLIYPLPNKLYNQPLFRINFIEEIPLKINKYIGKSKEEEMEISTVKNIKLKEDFIEKNCNLDEICYLTLEITYESKEDKFINIEIIPKSSKEIPSLLIPNYLKQDFIQLDLTQYYMAKLNKNTEGEIHFNYKRINGEISAKIVKIEKKSWKNKYDLPGKDETLIFDNFKQTVSFSKKETNKCDNGCYLFIGVYPKELYEDNYKLSNLFMDYSIFYFEKDYNNNAVNIKLNEIIQNSIEKINNMEYYRLDIIYSTHNIYFDVSGSENVIFIVNVDTKPKLNLNENDYYKILDGKDYIIEINNNIIKKLSEDLKGTILYIGIYTNRLNDGIVQYNFRGRANNTYIDNYIYTDTNTETICETKNNNETCIFLIPVVNNRAFIENNQNLFIYAVSTSSSDNLILSFSKVNLNKKEAIKFEYSTEGNFIKNMLNIPNNILQTLKEGEDILIKVEVPEKGTITLLNTFKTNIKESYIHFKSKIAFNVESNKELLLNIPSGQKHLVHINIIDGEGKVGFENDNENMQSISGKYSSMYLQSEENNKNLKIKVETKDNPFKFYSYIKIGTNTRNINKISIGSSAKFKTGEGFPIEFYSQLPNKNNNDYNINFRISNIKELNEINNLSESKTSLFIIKAFIVDVNTIEKLRNDESIIYSGNVNNTFEGKYESGFGIAKLIIKKEKINIIQNNNNYIYIVIDADSSNVKKFKNINAELNILEVNNIDYSAPDNIYLNGNLDSKNNKNEFKLTKKYENDKKIRVELSSSEEIKFSIAKAKISKISRNLEDIKYEESKGLGKKNIDINIENIMEPLIFSIYQDNITENKSIYYSFKYRTDKGNTKFTNYSNYGDNEGIIINNYTLEENKIKLHLKFPSVINKENQNLIKAKYYLKIFNYNENAIVVNDTISVIDSIHPVYSDEYNFEELNNYYEKDLILINNNNDSYYCTLSAVVIDDNEFIGYKSFIVNITKEKKKENDEKNKIQWWHIVLIVLLVILIVVLVIFIILHFKRKNSELIDEKTLNELQNNIEA